MNKQIRSTFFFLVVLGTPSWPDTSFIPSGTFHGEGAMVTFNGNTANVFYADQSCIGELTARVSLDASDQEGQPGEFYLVQGQCVLSFTPSNGGYLMRETSFDCSYYRGMSCGFNAFVHPE